MVANKEERIPEPPAFRLERLVTDSGEGYVVVRARDGQRLMWRTLRVSDGLFSFNIVGEKYREENIQGPEFSLGSELSLVPEPDNPHDSDAIAVYDSEERLQAGYVPADTTGRVRARWREDEDWKAIVAWESKEGGQRKNVRVLMIRRDVDYEVDDEPRTISEDHPGTPSDRSTPTETGCVTVLATVLTVAVFGFWWVLHLTIPISFPYPG